MVLYRAVERAIADPDVAGPCELRLQHQRPGIDLRRHRNHEDRGPFNTALGQMAKYLFIGPISLERRADLLSDASPDGQTNAVDLDGNA